MTNNPYYNLICLSIRVYARLMLRMNVRQHEELPGGPKLFVANHPSAMDPFLIHILTGDHVSVLITASAFEVPIFGPYITRTGQIPVVTGQGPAALEAAEKALREGRSIGIFPEGTFSPDGGFHRPRTGAARLALRTGIPVVPIGIHLLRERSWTIRSKVSGKAIEGHWYLHGPYNVTIGQPLAYQGDVEDRERVHEVAENMMTHIRRLALESRQRMEKPRLVQAVA
ncbi:MAG: 1-acyl-sn-glycerol-3-phosphate acyltransferase [Anaerolineales bacterium]|nr:1-acyl-sn-glycerol-3-phosphate acyltransferase [Anaerolineales bacterium]